LSMINSWESGFARMFSGMGSCMLGPALAMP
jgi:hypothetical protein